MVVPVVVHKPPQFALAAINPKLHKLARNHPGQNSSPASRASSVSATTSSGRLLRANCSLQLRLDIVQLPLRQSMSNAINIPGVNRGELEGVSLRLRRGGGQEKNHRRAGQRVRATFRNTSPKARHPLRAILTTPRRNRWNRIKPRVIGPPGSVRNAGTLLGSAQFTPRPLPRLSLKREVGVRHQPPNMRDRAASRRTSLRSTGLTFAPSPTLSRRIR